jgi:hypothetical protein
MLLLVSSNKMTCSRTGIINIYTIHKQASTFAVKINKISQVKSEHVLNAYIFCLYFALHFTSR